MKRLLVLLVLLPGAGHSHLGDRVFTIWEVPSWDIPDLTDGTLADWDAALPDASMTTYDFIRTPPGDTDESDLAVRVLLAWNNSQQRLYVAVERADDFLVLGPQGDRLFFMVDGDHSGGLFFFDDENAGTNQGQAQSYGVLIDADGSVSLEFGSQAFWAAESHPWEIGMYLDEGVPALTGVEMGITPWDQLSPLGPEASERSELFPGKIIGIQVILTDPDDSPESLGLFALEGHFGSMSNADFMVDAELVPCFVGDCSSPAQRESVVRQDSWGRIKASFLTD